jgi:4-amino-4-deoxy-L-arabinose transferase-like glycosyltransferase
VAGASGGIAFDPGAMRFRAPVPERAEPRIRVRTSLWERHRTWLIVGALVAAALVVRLLLVRGIWVDEAISIHQAHMSLPDMLENLRVTDRHPPLHYLLLWGMVRLFGDGELAMRLPSIIAGAALVPALFLCGRELFDRRTGLVASGLAACAPLAIWYAQEARMYSLFMLFAALALWAQIRVLRDGRRRYWIAYAGFTIALLYTHYFGLIPILIQQVFFAVAAWKRSHRGEDVRPLLIGCWATWGALVLAAAPLAPFAHEQYVHDQAAGTGFGSVPGSGTPGGAEGSSLSIYAVLSNFVWAIWGYHANTTMVRIAALWPLLMLVSLAALGRGRSDTAKMVIALAVGPVLLLLVAGLVKRDLFEVRYFAGAVPMLLLLLAAAVAGGARRRLPMLVATGVLLASFVGALVDQQLSSNNPRDFDYEGAISDVEKRAKPGDTVVYAPDYLRDVIAYYAPDLNAVAFEDTGGELPAGRVILFGGFLKTAGTAAEMGDAEAALRQSGRRLLYSSEHNAQIRIWEFG